MRKRTALTVLALVLPLTLVTVGTADARPTDYAAPASYEWRDASTWQHLHQTRRHDRRSGRSANRTATPTTTPTAELAAAREADTTTSPTPTLPPSTTTPAATASPTAAVAVASGSSGTEAATTRGWGAVVDGDEFTGSTVNTRKWGVYDNSTWAGANISVGGGVVTLRGSAAGKGAGMSMYPGRRYGRWETRMRVPAGDTKYHPDLLLWPDAEDWPIGGEVDYAETTAASSDIGFHLHFGANNGQVHGKRTVDLTQWHNYAVEWTPTAIRGFVDGQQFFEDTDTSHFPPRVMHQVLQFGFNGSGSAQASSMEVEFVRIYDV